LSISPKNLGINAAGVLEFSVQLGFNSSNSYSEVALVVIVNFSS